MDDKQIINMFLQRNEDAINALSNKYGPYCYRIANNILGNKEDSEECVNDTWNKVWSRIPPIIPHSLKAFTGKIVRDIALSKYRKEYAMKRYSGVEVMFEELEECIPSETSIEKSVDEELLSQAINNWLSNLKKDDRIIFVKRYYYGTSVKDLAKEFGRTEKHMAQVIFRLRGRLKEYLRKKGF